MNVGERRLRVCAAASARAQTDARIASSRMGKIASSASPMNFSTSPPPRIERRAHAAEILVEQLDQRVARQLFGQAGEAAQVAQPDDRADGLAHAAPDRAVQHARAGLAADIGVEQGARGKAQRLNLEIDRDARRDGLEQLPSPRRKSRRAAWWRPTETSPFRPRRECSARHSRSRPRCGDRRGCRTRPHAAAPSGRSAPIRRRYRPS